VSGTLVLVLALPGALCAVMAWDLSRPTSTPPRMRERAAAGALAVAAGSCLAAALRDTALWDTAATRATGLLAAVCLLAVVAGLSRGRRRGRRGRRWQAAVPAQRMRLHVAVPVPAAPAPTTDRTKEPA